MTERRKMYRTVSNQVPELEFGQYALVNGLRALAIGSHDGNTILLTESGELSTTLTRLDAIDDSLEQLQGLVTANNESVALLTSVTIPSLSTQITNVETVATNNIGIESARIDSILGDIATINNTIDDMQLQDQILEFKTQSVKVQSKNVHTWSINQAIEVIFDNNFSLFDKYQVQCFLVFKNANLGYEVSEMLTLDSTGSTTLYNAMFSLIPNSNRGYLIVNTMRITNRTTMSDINVNSNDAYIRIDVLSFTPSAV